MNHLQREKSPYLLQHLDNPVDWYPWGEAVFARARAEKRLIFLSIGYSTCHWCHVMAHECFEDEAVAKMLNHHYLSIKVDREERPDIDQVYMEACQKMTGRGGWPLTIFMTPDAQPFYAATYIPRESRRGQPGMLELLPWLAAKWQDEPELLLKAARETVAGLNEPRSDEIVPADCSTLAKKAEQSMKSGYDRHYGGFGQAPKFPRPHDLTFLLRRYRLTADNECLAMAEHTLQMMHNGGLYDQLGYGFHRYSTDRQWLVPHFEKMLYDQAGLLIAFLDAWLLTGNERYARAVRETITYLVRDMLAPEGAFYSAEDADSEGVEGKFYLWTEAEVRAVLGAQAEAFCTAYHVRVEGNFRDEMTGELTGENILHLRAAKESQGGDTAQTTTLVACREILFHRREQRVRPHLDDKIITSWNGFVISALSRAGRALPELAWLDHANRAADFVLGLMRDGNGRLFRRYRQGESAVSGFSEDYAFMARGLLDLYAADFDPQRLAQAVQLAEALRTQFQDPVSGQLYDTPADGEKLLKRPSSTFDGAVPSAAAITLEVFARLFLLTGNSSWQDSAERLLRSCSSALCRYPAGYTQFLQATEWLLRPTRVVVIVGYLGAVDTEAMLSVVRCNSLLQTVVLLKDQADAQNLASLSPFVTSMTLTGGEATAYVCQNFTCLEPMVDAAELERRLTTPVH